MSYDRENEDALEKVSSLLKTLIEVELSQNTLLSGLSRKIDTVICILEHISKNTCETLNEVHEQSGLQARLMECKEACMPPHSTVRECCEIHPAAHHIH